MNANKTFHRVEWLWFDPASQIMASRKTYCCFKMIEKMKNRLVKDRIFSSVGVINPGLSIWHCNLFIRQTIFSLIFTACF